MRRKKIIIGTIIALLLFCVAGYFGWRVLSIQYHRSEMISAYTKLLSSKPADPNYQRLRSSYAHHRSALMECGYFVKQQFYLKKISAQSRAFQDFLGELQERFPTKTGKIEGHGYIYGEPTFVVVWLHPSDAKLIENFIQEQDAK